MAEVVFEGQQPAQPGQANQPEQHIGVVHHPVGGREGDGPGHSGTEEAGGQTHTPPPGQAVPQRVPAHAEYEEATKAHDVADTSHDFGGQRCRLGRNPEIESEEASHAAPCSQPAMRRPIGRRKGVSASTITRARKNHSGADSQPSSQASGAGARYGTSHDSTSSGSSSITVGAAR